MRALVAAGGALYVGTGERDVCVWDVPAAVKATAAGAPLAPTRIIKGDKRGCGALALARDGAVLCVGSGRLACLDASTGGRLAHSAKHATAIGAVAAVPGADRMLTACGDRFVSVWDAPAAAAAPAAGGGGGGGGAVLEAAGSLVAPAPVARLVASPAGAGGLCTVAAVLTDGAMCLWRYSGAGAGTGAAEAGARVAPPAAGAVLGVHLPAGGGEEGAAAVVAVGSDAAVRFERIAVLDGAGALRPGALHAAARAAGPAPGRRGGEGEGETVVDAAVPAQARCVGACACECARGVCVGWGWKLNCAHPSVRAAACWWMSARARGVRQQMRRRVAAALLSARAWRGRPLGSTRSGSCSTM